MSNVRKLWTLLLFAAAILPSALAAQQRGTVSGQVTETGTGRALAGAQVSVQGTTLRVVTSGEGRFQLSNVPAGTQRITASVIGHASSTQSVSVSAGAAAVTNFTLAPAAISLDEVIVTGTAGNQQRRAQAAQVARVEAATIVEQAPVTTTAQILQSRIAGVSVSSASGTSGGAQQIRIRGASSVSLSNEPIVFIDGIRSNSSNTATYGVGGQATSRLNDINPEDIESIEVVKGPAAATLYGADASAGVIQIITKRGRAGASRFTQSVNLEYNQIDADFTPPSNFFLCTRSDSLAARTAAGLAGSPACGTVPVGTTLEDNPLVRESAFRTGNFRSLGWTGRGGGENFGYYLSGNADTEEGTLPNNEYDRYSGRVNFNFIPTPKLRFDAGFGLIDTRANLPINDNQIYGFLGGAMLGTPRTLGGPNNGFFGANRNVAAITAIESRNRVIRVQPRIEVGYNPFRWFTNRITVGADLTRTEAFQFYPRNSLGSYGGELNTGSIGEARENGDRYTFDYLGNMRSAFGHEGRFTSDFSFGAQTISNRFDQVFSQGTGLTTNAARVVSAAATRSGGQDFSQTRQLGLLVQEQVGVADRLFIQAGLRADRFSSFGADAEYFLLPKVGISYVISEEPFFERALPFVSSLRVRGAYGQTGRSPNAGASLQTFDPAPFAIIPGSATGAGVIALNPGNNGLKAERGKEFEVGAEAGLFRNRLSVDVTYFDKRTTDLLLRVPQPPSLGFSANPFQNIGAVQNKGIEAQFRARALDRRNVALDLNLQFSTLHNELTSLGGVPAFNTLNRFAEGRPLGAFYDRPIRRVVVDTATVNGRFVNNSYGVVADSIEFVGNLLPTREGSLSGTLTLFSNLHLYGQVDTKRNFMIYNNTHQFRDRQLRNSELSQILRRDSMSLFDERVRTQGPFRTETGLVPIGPGEVNGPFLEDGTFTRLRELSLTYDIPQRFSRAFKSSSTSVTLAARNLKLWSDYSGADPEVISGIDPSLSQFTRAEFLTVPTPQRIVARINVQF